MNKNNTKAQLLVAVDDRDREIRRLTDELREANAALASTKREAAEPAKPLKPVEIGGVTYPVRLVTLEVEVADVPPKGYQKKQTEIGTMLQASVEGRQWSAVRSVYSGLGFPIIRFGKEFGSLAMAVRHILDRLADSIEATQPLPDPEADETDTELDAPDELAEDTDTEAAALDETPAERHDC